MTVRYLLALVAPLLLTACATGGGPALSSKDKLFLQKMEALGSRMTGDGAETNALAIGRTFCVEMRSGAGRQQADETVYTKYPSVSLADIHDATIAAGLIYCPETLP